MSAFAINIVIFLIGVGTLAYGFFPFVFLKEFREKPVTNREIEKLDIRMLGLTIIIFSFLFLIQTHQKENHRELMQKLTEIETQQLHR